MRAQRYSCVAIAMVALCTAWSNAAGLDGDKRILETAAAAYRENFDRLQTWSGSASYISSSKKPGGRERSVEAIIEFAYDAQNHKRWYRIETTKDVRTVNGQESPGARLMVHGGLFMDDTWYELTYLLPNGSRTAYLRPKQQIRPGWHCSSFDPTFYMQHDGPVDRYLLTIAEHHADDDLTGSSVSQAGTTVTLTQVMSAGRLKAERTIALDQGGNLVRLRSESTPADMELRVEEIIWQWQQVNDVWVPTKVTWDDTGRQNKAAARHIEIEWKNVKVNQTFAKDQFTLPRLDLRQGDHLKREGAPEYITVTGSEFPPGPPRRIRRQPAPGSPRDLNVN